MRRRWHGACLAVLLAAAPLWAAPPDIKAPAEVKGDPGSFIPVTVETSGKAVKFLPLDAGLNVFPAGLLADPKSTVVTAAAPGRYRLLAYTGNADGPSEPVTVTVVVGSAPPPQPPGPGPSPPGPGPNPPPQPVKTFRVFLIYESMQTVPAGQTSVLYGKAVEDWLNANCTGGRAGWDRRDKDLDPSADRTALKELWAATKPAVTTTPCIAVEVNGRVTIEPLPATPADALTLLKKYRGN